MTGSEPHRFGGLAPTGQDTEPVGLLYIGDVRALRRAEIVTFHSTGHGSWIHAGLSAPATGEPRIYTAMEQRLFPDADCSGRWRRIAVDADIAGFDDQRRWHERHLPGAAAFTIVDTAGVNEVWRSIAVFLRVGDVIRLRWRADNTVDRLADPGWHRDELSIGVHRGRRRWLFLLDVQVRPGPARMITRAAT